VVCREDDARFSPADKKLTETVRAWRKDGIDVRIATPWMIRRYDKSDLNDTARALGMHAVSGRIEVAYIQACFGPE
jgi:hypothetical protein